MTGGQGRGSSAAERAAPVTAARARSGPAWASLSACLLPVLVAVGLTLVSAFLVAPPVRAAEAGLLSTKHGSEPQTEDKALQRLIEAAKANGSTIMVIAPPAATPAAPPITAGQSALLMLLHLRTAVAELAEDIPAHIRTLPQGIQHLRDRGILERTAWASRVALISNIIGVFCIWLYSLWSRQAFRRLSMGNADHRADRIAVALGRLSLLLGGVAVFAVSGATAAVTMAQSFGETERLFRIFQLPFAELLLASIAVLTVLAPRSPNSRLVPLGDDDARRVSIQLIAIAAFAALSGGFIAWVEIAGLPRSLMRFSIIAALNISCVALLLVALSLSGRAVVRRTPPQPVETVPDERTAEALEEAVALERKAEREATHIPASRFFIRHWHQLVVLAVIIAATIGTGRALLDHPRPIAPIIGPFVVIAGGVLAYAVMVFIIDSLFARAVQEKRVDTKERRGRERRVLASRRNIVRALFEHAALITAIAMTLTGILTTWGVDVTDPEGPFARFAGLILVVFVSIMAYRAVKLWLDEEIAIERYVAADESAHGESTSIVGATTRLGTLLMIVRNFLLASIVVVALMIALDELGVNIAPLFAGAGVIGIAIGFGAQSLIKDMFSGMFYLIDDAFRTGEYIDIGVVKGTVEKISIRSFQLRHQNGPLNTVPFGEIKKLTNYSRDWVIVKLPIRVTYDTPVSKINQIVKKISKELLEDEDVGHLFLQPLKSQGVYEMEDSAMVVRVKFMTKPNEQFVVQRMVYAKIREEFTAAGIKFAHRNVTVYVANPDGSPVTDPARAAAAAGSAIAPILDAEAAAAQAEEEEASEGKNE